MHGASKSNASEIFAISLMIRALEVDERLGKTMDNVGKEMAFVMPKLDV
jgi:hypothetical protein